MHTFNKPANTLKVAMATTLKIHLLDDVVLVYGHIYHLAACAMGFI